MATQLRVDRSCRFEARTSPPAEVLGRALDSNRHVGGAVLQLRFGEQVASLTIADVWSACCELLLNAELAREGSLEHFVLDVEQIFEASCAGEMLLCVFSREHAFAVSRTEFAASLEGLVGQILGATSCPALTEVGAAWGAASIRGLPYFARFTESELV